MKSRGIVVGLMIIQAALLITRIDYHSLWLDEIMSLDAVSRLPSFFAQFPEQHPLYYIILRGWMALGHSDAWLRALSAVFAVASTPLLFLLARRLSGERTALTAAALMVFSPFFVYYGQEARMYTLLTLLAIGSTLAFVKWQEDGTRASAGAYVLTGILGMYTHFFFLFLLFAHLVAALLRDPATRWPAVRQTVLANSLVGVVYAPWAMFMASHGAAGRAQPWKGMEQVILSVPYTLMRFAVGYAELLTNAGWRANQLSTIRADIGVLSAAVVAFGVLTILGIRELATRDTWSGRTTLACLVAPASASLLASVVVILVGERYWIVSFPFFLITVAAGLEVLRRKAPRWVAGATGVLCLAVIAKSLGDYYLRPDFGKEQWREAAAYVAANRSPGEQVIVSPREVFLPFSHYFGPGSVPAVQYASPESLPAMKVEEFWWVTSYLPDPETLAGHFGPSYRIADKKFFPKETGIWVFRVEGRAS